MKEKLLSLRSNRDIINLFEKIKNYQPLSNRTEILNEAIDIALKEKSINWKKISNSKISEIKPNSITPEFIQIRVDENKFQEIINTIKSSFVPPLKRITTPYVVKLLLINYLNYLNKISDNVEIEIEKTVEQDCFNISDIDIPKIYKLLSELIIEDINSIELKEIKKILINWRSKK